MTGLISAPLRPIENSGGYVSLVGKVQWALRHPASTAHPATTLTRLAMWRARTLLKTGATVPMDQSAMRFRCPPEWRGNAKMMYVWRDGYETEMAQLHRWSRPGDLVVDVGAHYGCYTLPLARLVGDAGRVVAVEPARHARSVLMRNIALNGLDNVQVLPVAAGAETTAGVLHMHSDRSRASLHRMHGAEVGSEKVKVVRLDDILLPGRQVSLIKMDVEGHESQAFKGMSGTLVRDRPVVIFELLPRNAGPGVQGAWDLLADYGYRMHRVTDDGDVVRVERPDQDRGSTNNVVAIHPDGREEARATARAQGGAGGEPCAGV